MAIDDARVDPGELDLVVLAQLAGHALALAVQEQIAASGTHSALRARYGFVFQHLIGGPLPVSVLAERLGVSQQAASKTVAEMVGAGYLTREADPADARVRHVALSDLGRRAVADGRTARVELTAAITERLGPRTTATLRRALLEVLDVAGGTEAVAGRRVVPLD